MIESNLYLTMLICSPQNACLTFMAKTAAENVDIA